MAGQDRRGIYLPQTIFASTRFKLVWRINQGGVAVDLTGMALDARIMSEEGGGTTILDLTPTSANPLTGIVTIEKTDTNMDISPGNYWWYANYTPDTGQTVGCFYGPFDIDRFEIPA